jgi:PAS domain S-box-containing protein
MGVNEMQEKIMLNQLPFLDFIPLGLVFMDQDTRILMVNRFAADKLHRKKEDLLDRVWSEEFSSLLTEESDKDFEASKTIHFTYGEETFIGQKSRISKNGEFTGVVLVFQSASVLEEVTKELDSYKNLSLDLKAIFDTSYDVIYVSDGKGITLRVSSACERLWGYREEDLVGKSIYQLEREGVFKPSVTRMVLEKEEKVALIQTTKTGRRLMVVGTPIKDDEGRIIRVVNASRDITEVSQLQSELEEMKQLTEGYRHELMDLRTKNEFEKQIISQSEKMRKVVTFSQKISQVDSTVLLLGESGVGKEIIASFIHKLSTRQKKPFIGINCGAIPEALLESELFGYEQGAGASKEGKLGLFEMANEGTLFLDEIEVIPLAVQVKLMRVLQEKEIVRTGGTKPIKLNVRVIAATDSDLGKAVQSGRFREDLYYLLNVVPIAIPPLRERREDIIPLILHFTEQLNKKYGVEKKFNPGLLKRLQGYDWPGNVRELQNIIERLIVTTDETWIGPEHLPEHITTSLTDQKSVQVNKIIPLNEAIDQLEKKLLEMAQKKYGSTTKMAEVLGVNQSTISRKLQRHLKK